MAWELVADVNNEVVATGVDDAIKTLEGAGPSDLSEAESFCSCLEQVRGS